LAQSQSLPDRRPAVGFGRRFPPCFRRSDPGHDLADNENWIFGPRIIGRHNRPVGVTSCQFTHDRPFGPVPVAAAAEHDNQLSPDKLLRGFQNIFQTIGGMGVIHDDAERARNIDPLEASGNLFEFGESRLNHRNVDSFGATHANRGQHVIHIEQAGQPGSHRKLPPPPGDPETGALRLQVNIYRPEIRLFRHPVADPACFGLRQHIFAGRIIDVGDGRFIGLLVAVDGQLPEHQGFGIPIVFHGLMKIEMILRHVGKHRRVDLAAGDAPQRQSVGRHLHGNGPHAAVNHIAQRRLQIQHIRRRILDRNDPVADQGVERAADAAGPAGPVKNAPDDMGRGCLAVGAGDADQAQLRRWIPVKPGRDPFHRLTDIRRPNDRNRVRAGHFLFGQHRNRPFCHG